MDEFPAYSTQLSRITISPIFTGLRKSMLSVAPSTAGPFANLKDVMLPVSMIQSMSIPPCRVPWLFECSGSTYWTILLTVSRMEIMGFLAARRRGVRSGRSSVSFSPKNYLFILKGENRLASAREFAEENFL